MPSPAHPIERKLAAIFAADVAGYSRLMGQDEVGTLRTLAAHREIMDRISATSLECDESLLTGESASVPIAERAP